jgi:hypothetical protein
LRSLAELTLKSGLVKTKLNSAPAFTRFASAAMLAVL